MTNNNKDVQIYNHADGFSNINKPISEVGANKGYHILTYGCQMNVRDSEIMQSLVEDMGYVKTDLEKADLVIFNTCSVRHSAENKVYGKLGYVSSLKKKKPDLIIAFGGCMAQLPETLKNLQKQRVDIVFGTHNLHELPQLIERVQQGEKKVREIWDKHHGIVENLPDKRENQLISYVNIMYGCDNFCSYCIVPFTRGRERSRNPVDILKEIKSLASSGCKEVTLLGQNVNSYGRGLEEKIDFADLLYQVNEIEGIERIRFTTSHPKDLSDRLITAVTNCDKVCEYIHVALQAGSNKILKRMNRGYTREYYLDMVKRIRDGIPGVALGTDIIVGFPGETEEDFEETLDMLEKIRFDSAFTFVYSIRSGTRAANFLDQIPAEIKKERIMCINNLQYQISAEINKGLEGSTQEVLVEGPSKSNPDKLTGRTRDNKIVVFSGTNDLIGRLINVKIAASNTFTTFGEPV